MAIGVFFMFGFGTLGAMWIGQAIIVKGEV
ncbi:MAG: hypothetical protein ACJAUG_001767 [Halioglobus sp.]|jgi:hypothetical protein